VNPHSTSITRELVRLRQDEVRYEVRGHRRRKARWPPSHDHPTPGPAALRGRASAADRTGV